MSDHITPEEVVSFFSQNNPTEAQKKRISKGLLVSTKCRKELLLGAINGKVIVGGIVKELKFTNLQGGVWRVNIGEAK